MFWARAATGIILSAAMAASGCHNIPSAALSSEFSFGDTVAFPLRVTEFDPVAERVKVRIGEPANLIALEVSPGKSITIVDLPDSRSPRGYRALSTIDVVDPTSPITASTEYTRCIDDAVRRATPRPQPQRRPVVKRDSTGKPLLGQSTEPLPERPSEAPAPTAAMKSTCRVQVMQLQRALSKQRGDERYVLILASDANFMRNQLIERLNSLSVVATDVKSTMDAIATGIFAGKASKWSGYAIER